LGVVGDISFGRVVCRSGRGALIEGTGMVALVLGPFLMIPRLEVVAGLLIVDKGVLDRDGSCEGVVAAVRVSIGGGRIGTAVTDAVEEAVDREDEVESLR
jgi:hypothetical protein